jgi:DNA-directed RNA polymerase specialized sigma24 family protein
LDIDYKEIHRQASSYAKRHGKRNDADDFAQECVLYAFEKGVSDFYVARRFSDYLRRNYGRSGTPGGDARRHFESTRCVYDEESFGSEPLDRLDTSRIPEYLVGLSRYERLIYVLKEKYEVPIAQIADSQGVSSSRISHVISGIQKTIYQKASRKESGVQRDGEKEVERILKEEGQGVECETHSEMAKFESFALASFDAESL